MLITATYTDKGGAGIKPLSSVGSVSLKSALVNMPSNSGNLRVEIKDWNKHRAAFLNISQGNNGWLEFSNIDLESIGSIEFEIWNSCTVDEGLPDQLAPGFSQWTQDCVTQIGKRIKHHVQYKRTSVAKRGAWRQKTLHES